MTWGVGQFPGQTHVGHTVTPFVRPQLVLRLTVRRFGKN
jgi:hypothetical protein